MELSIIIPTKNRLKEIESLFDSIKLIDCFNFEVIVVDQNVQNFIHNLVNTYASKFIIKHIRVDCKGVSEARNVGIKNAKGKVLCFPDDDCRFYADTVKEAFKRLNDYDVVFGKCIDEFGSDSVINFSKEQGSITLKNCHNRFVEATMFAKKEILDQYLFDEELGVGTFHGSEEAYDLVIRLLNDNRKLYYSPTIKLYHPQKISNHGSTSELKRVFSYRCGYAKLCRKHRFYSKYLKRFMLVLFAIPIYAVFNRDKFRYYSAELSGLITGIIIR